MTELIIKSWLNYSTIHGDIIGCLHYASFAGPLRFDGIIRAPTHTNAHAHAAEDEEATLVAYFLASRLKRGRERAKERRSAKEKSREAALLTYIK